MKRLIAGLAGLTAITAVPAQDPAQIPIADFLRPPEVVSAKLSPNGEYIATSRLVNDNKHAVGVTELATNKVTATLAFGTGESVGNYWWVSPTRLVAAVALNWGRLEQPAWTGELIGIDANGKNHRYLYGYRGADTAGTKIQVGPEVKRGWAEMVATLPAEPGHALIQTRPWGDKEYADIVPSLERLNVTNGQRKFVDKSGVDLLLPAVATDDAGGALLAAGWHRSGHWDLQARTADGKGWTGVSLPEGVLSSVVLEGNARDGSAGYFTTHRNGKPNCLHEVRFETRAVTDLACGNYDAVVTSSTDGKPIALHYEDGLPRTEYLLPDHPEAKRLRAITSAFPGQRVRLAGTTLDGLKLLVRVEADRSPGGYYLLDEATRKLSFLAPARRWIDPRLMQPMAAVAVKARDGVQVPAYLTARDGLKTRKAPLVVLPHGGPHGIRDYWVWNPEVQLLASRGYAVLQVNYRGSSGYGHDFEFAGYRNWGRKIQQDIADATRWAIAEGIADPARICIYGGSFGGYSALMSAAQEPDLYRCAVGAAGPYDLETMVSDSDVADFQIGRTFMREALGTDKAELREQSPVTHASRIKAALLLAHGTRDKRVPFKHARLMREALDRAGKPYEWLEYAGEEHGFFSDENELDFYTKLLAFLDKHIGAGAAPGKG
ncbi:MAG: alpha/beta hydrolase family protein [Nevskiaceae bacterium]